MRKQGKEQARARAATLVVSFLLCLVYVDVLTATVACSSDGTQGQACQTDQDCLDDRVCNLGQCVPRDSGTQSDSGFDGAADASGPDSALADAAPDAETDATASDAALDSELADAPADALLDAPPDVLVDATTLPDATAVDATAVDAMPLPDATTVDAMPLPDATAVDAMPLPDATFVDAMPLPDASFVDGPPPAQALLRINELNANITGGCDLIELRVVSAGPIGSFRLTERQGNSGELDYTFPSAFLSTNAIIVVHLNSGSATCNPGGATSETLSPTQQPAASFGGNYDTAFDFWVTDGGLTATDNVLTLFDSTGKIVDVVLVASAPTGTTAAASEVAAAAAASANQWQMIGGGVPTGGFVDDNFRAHAVLDLDATGTAATGTSLQRLDNTDDNDEADWSSGAGPAQTFGLINAGQVPF